MTRLIRRFVSFACCLLFALSLLGCAEPLSLGSLHALNPRSYAGTICGIPKGTPSNTRFYAVNAAMRKVVTDRHPEALRDFMTIADSVHEVSTSAPPSSAKNVPISMGVTCPARDGLPADLRAALDKVVATPCELAENNRPDPHYIAQTQKIPHTPEDIGLKLVSTVLTWAFKASAAPDSQMPRPADMQTVPLPGLERLPQTTITEAETPSLLEHPVTQFSGGAVSGGLIGAVPFGPIGADVAIELRLVPKGTYWARVGKACGEIVIGTGEMILGCAGISAGAGMSGTGVGAVPGVLVISGSYALAGNGCLTAGTGLAELHQLWREGDPATNASAGSSAPAPTESVLKPKPPPAKPAAKPAVEAPPPGTLIVQESAGGTVTKTRRRAPAGKPPPETTTTITTSASGNVTTTRKKGKSSSASAEAPPVAKGAKRGPKTDPAAPHNAARIKDRKKLEAEGNKILAGGGGELREKLVRTPGGIKSGRRPDTTFRTPDGAKRGRNYGKTKADGTPVKREQEALDDLNKHGKVPTDFVPYDRETP